MIYLIDDGFYYIYLYKHKTNDNEMIRKYICEEHTNGCRAYAMEKEDTVIVIKGIHNHVPYKNVSILTRGKRNNNEKNTCKLIQRDQPALDRKESCPRAARNKDGDIPEGMLCNMDGQADSSTATTGADPMWERPKGREYDTGTPPRETDGICC